MVINDSVFYNSPAYLNWKAVKIFEHSIEHTVDIKGIGCPHSNYNLYELLFKNK